MYCIIKILSEFDILWSLANAWPLAWSRPKGFGCLIYDWLGGFKYETDASWDKALNLAPSPKGQICALTQPSYIHSICDSAKSFTLVNWNLICQAGQRATQMCDFIHTSMKTSRTPMNNDYSCCAISLLSWAISYINNNHLYTLISQ
jgi:hypothetical protein